MAERRMFSKSVINSDAFLDLPPSSRCLYFQLCMDADDDGFNDKVNATIRMIGASSKDMDRLIDSGFIIRFQNGTIVDTFWRRNNLIKKDRYRKTVHQEEFAMLELTNDGMYKLKDDVKTELKNICEPRQEAVGPNCFQTGTKLEPERNQTGTKLEPQVRLGKDRLNNNTIHKSTTVNNILSKPKLSTGLLVDNSDSQSLSSAGNVAAEISELAAQDSEPDTTSPPLDGLDFYNLSGGDAFKFFRNVYPRHEGTLRDVQSAWLTATVGGHVLPGDLILAAKRYADECRQANKNPAYIKMPQNFIASGAWKQYAPKYLPSCPKCRGKGVYKDGDGMTMCDCCDRYKEVTT